MREQIARARQAQQDHQQKHDVQLEIPKPRLPLFDSGDPELGNEISEMFGGGSHEWPTEDEKEKSYLLDYLGWRGILPQKGNS
jgi:hypothetical protein